jgi:hypothetical protein
MKLMQLKLNISNKFKVKINILTFENLFNLFYFYNFIHIFLYNLLFLTKI